MKNVSEHFPKMVSLVLLVVGVQFVVPCADVCAQSDTELDRARNSFINGARAAESGSWVEAERHFREAYEISGRESPLYNWALSLKELERHREAAEQLDNLLRNHEPDEEMRGQARGTLDELKKFLVVLSIVNLEPDVAYVIYVGEREIFDGGERPLEVFVEPGDLRVSVQAAGDSDAFVWEHQAPPGGKETVDVTEQSAVDMDDEVVGDDDDGGFFSSTAFWIVAGVVVAAGAGVGIYLVADGSADLKPESGNVLRLP